MIVTEWHLQSDSRISIVVKWTAASRASKGTASHVSLDDFRVGANVKVEDVDGQTHGRAAVRNIDNACYMTLHRRTGKQEVDLIVTVPVAPKVFNNAQAGLSVCNGGVEIILFAVLVDAKAFKVNVAAGTELRGSSQQPL